MRFHLPNEGVEGLESASFFYVHGFFFFTYMVHCKYKAVIYDIALMR